VLTLPRIRTRNTHGTGCSLSSAMAALRPRRGDWLEATRDAKKWLAGALAAADSLEVGSGRGPVHHFFDAWGGR
jgi:hydroxymethylpyrimidine/phosphomethylpyrimidine kinase